MRTLIATDPFIPAQAGASWRAEPVWPCSWIASGEAADPPFVIAYRLRCTLEEAATVRVHVTADERYKLFLDGEQIGMGPERGDAWNWFFETYDLPLSAGEHVIVAQVWSLGELAAMAQMSVHPGFLFAAEGEWARRLGSGHADWQWLRLDGYGFVDPTPAHWREHRVVIDGGAIPWGWQQGQGSGWQPAVTVKRAVGRHVDWETYKEHILSPALLPPMMAVRRQIGAVRLVAEAPAAETRPIPVQSSDHRPGEAAAWQALIHGKEELIVPAHTRHRVIVDLENYYCAYPELLVTGGEGALVRVHWCEALHLKPEIRTAEKGHRDEIEGKYFIGIGDTFLPDGGDRRYFEPLWYQAGRYVEIYVQTAGQPLTIHSFALRETRYPLEPESRFSAADPRLEQLTPILVRGIQASAHETFYDSPYYEELMYASDTRLECLATYTMAGDDRLPRKALRMFDRSRFGHGFTQGRYPSRVTQIIPAWSLWNVGMVYDYAFWRGRDEAFVRDMLAGARMTLETFLRFRRGDGLLHMYDLPGWNGHMDWVTAWPAGIPPAARRGPSSMHNWQLAYALTLVAELEDHLGEAEMATRFRQRAQDLAGRLEIFWDEGRGLYADDPEGSAYCEHSQILAILSGQLPPARQERLLQGLIDGAGMERATVHYVHYLFEVCYKLGAIDLFHTRLQEWYEMIDMGFVAPREKPEPSRSDCHGWSSHPYYHYFATILGIRPASPGFRRVSIRPQLGALDHAQGALVHPDGMIRLSVQREGETLHGEISLPAGVTGTLEIGGQCIDLADTIVHF